jgi:hypothetical protein
MKKKNTTASCKLNYYNDNVNSGSKKLLSFSSFTWQTIHSMELSFGV